MALQIANPVVVMKVEKLATRIGLTKTAAVEHAVDQLLNEVEAVPSDQVASRFAALLLQLDQIPERVDALDPIERDGPGLPK